MSELNTSATNSKLSDKQLSFLLALLVAIMPFSIDTYLPAMPMMAEALNSNVHTIEKSLSVYLIGAALGQLFGGALSDLKGRKPICLIGLAIFLLSTACITQITQADHLIWLRLVQGLGAGMATVIVPAMVRDRYTGVQAAQMFATIGIIIMIAPAIAPMVGALIQSVWGWQAIFVFLLLYGAALLVCMQKFLPHSRPQHDPNERFWAGIFSRYRSVLKRKEAMGFLLLQGFCFSCMLVFLTESSWVYQHHYGLSHTQYAWAFMFNILTMALFNRTTAWRLKKGSAPKSLLKAGLVIQISAALLLLIWTSISLPPLPVMMILLMLSVGAQGLIVPSNQAIYMSYFGREAGSANALLGSSMMIIAGVVAGITAQLHALSAGKAVVMPAMMFASSLCAIVAVYTLSRSAFEKPQN